MSGTHQQQHSSPIKTPKQLITVVVLAFVVPIAIIVLLVTYVAGGQRESAGSRVLTPEAVAERLRPVGTVVLAEAGGARTLQAGDAVYKLACVACHGAGVAGAPKSGDATAWAPRIKQGYDTLLKHAIEGFKAMPAKGGNADLDNVEVARAVVYMANESGAKFKEPAAPAAAPAAAAPAAAASTPAAAALPPLPLHRLRSPRPRPLARQILPRARSSTRRLAWRATLQASPVHRSSATRRPGRRDSRRASTRSSPA